MIANPKSSRRIRLFGAIAVLAALTTYLHLRPQIREPTYDYALSYYETVAHYFHPQEHVYNNTLYSEGTEEVVDQYYNSSQPCANFPDTEGIMLVMKTGATEAFDRIPTHLLTTMRCLPDFLIFSDMEQQIGSYHVYDALAEVEESTKAHNSDFDLYRDQKECPVSQKSCIDARDDTQKAWNLDKYKFLPMMEQTWRLRPGRDWYVFVEADTYIFWENLVQWLWKYSNLNPREKLYLGSRSFIAGMPFAHGGSGYVISGTLLKHLIEYHPGVVKEYNQKGNSECCGDLLLAQALDDYENVKIRQAWPLFNGEKPSTLPYGPGHWCEPILTMHHMNAEEISSVWQFEQTRKNDRPLMIRDLYETFMAPKMQVSRSDWDNLSDDTCYVNPDPEAQERAEGFERDRQKEESEMSDIEKEAWKSWENCAKVCQSEIPEDDEIEFDAGIWGRNDDNPATASDTNAAEDTSPSDQSLREARQRELTEKRKNRQCFQYRWHEEVCCTSRSFKLGGPKAKPESGYNKHRWMSGWHLKGINDWIDAMGECKEPAWKEPER